MIALQGELVKGALVTVTLEDDNQYQGYLHDTDCLSESPEELDPETVTGILSFGFSEGPVEVHYTVALAYVRSINVTPEP